MLPLRFSVDRKQFENRAFRIYDNLVINPYREGCIQGVLERKTFDSFSE